MLLGIFQILKVFNYWTFTIYGAGFSCFVSSFMGKAQIFFMGKKPNSWIPTTPFIQWFRLFPLRSPLLRESLFVFFSSGY